MLVQCPSCSARYRVNASNIPNTGGRIRCPSCSHTFVVYPEAAPAAPAAASYEEAKTSIANIQDLMQGANALRQQQAASSEDDGATEIMSGASLPNFANIFGGGGGAPPGGSDDGTVEMQNPMALLAQAGLNSASSMAEDEGDGATEIVSADMMFGMGGDPFAAPSPAPTPSSPPSYAPPSQQPGYAPPLQQPGPGFVPQRTVSNQDDATQITGPDQLGDFSFPPPASPSPSGQALGSALFDAHSSDTVEASPLSFGGAPPATPAPAAPSGGSTLDPSYTGPWKLKTSFGLTYEFQDTASLQGWMSSRDDLSGYTLAGDDEQFRELGLYPQIGGGAPAPSVPTMALHGVQPPQASPAPSSPAPMPPMSAAPAPLDQPGGGFGAPPAQPAQAPRQPGARINTEYKPPSGGGSRRWVTMVLFALFALFGLGTVGLSLHIFKVVDMRALLGGAPAVAPAPTPKPEVAKPPVEKEPEEKAPEEKEISEEAKRQARDFIREAELSIKNNKLPPARQVLEKAMILDPTNLKTYDLLAETYDKLGQFDKATETRNKVKAMRADGLENDAPAPELKP